MVYYQEILDKYKKLPKNKQIIKFFEEVRDIPYGEINPRSPENTWKHNLGTCSTKNTLLRDLFVAIDIPTQIWMCSFAFYPSKIFPDNMNELLEPPVIVYHTFLKIEIDGKWIDVDATHDKGLEQFGFKVVEHWDGKSDTILAVNPVDYFHPQDVEEFKHQQDAKLSLDERMRKSQFMELFFHWIDALR